MNLHRQSKTYAVSTLRVKARLCSKFDKPPQSLGLDFSARVGWDRSQLGKSTPERWTASTTLNPAKLPRSCDELMLDRQRKSESIIPATRCAGCFSPANRPQ